MKSQPTPSQIFESLPWFTYPEYHHSNHPTSMVSPTSTVPYKQSPSIQKHYGTKLTSPQTQTNKPPPHIFA
ncbi:hypothetical protein L873DRAFT_1814591 [Choiromyces venosus 120613-1]|uniref:Uncharacterized protein n=1 Tax=Choiromyces venosus 120613-1 TaxID=1336337 RepID=A0A3N4J7K2_9PEZI|nr:hypothetical protein L873DRAFT_1814591 [Choiromyces venosus 120613-1]